MDNLRVTLLQTDIIWEEKSQNLERLHEKLRDLHGDTDLVILPEMFTTGFSMNSEKLAESIDGNTLSSLKTWADEYGIAICGSYIAGENGKYFNRAFFVTPGQKAWFYDKRHLFRMGNEINHFTAGDQRAIVTYKGWKICMLICYDLRFPVWSRNTDNQYDLLIYSANWPSSRQHVWNTLLPARAIENMCYVCGVNRIGTDGNNLYYTGGSTIYSPKGVILAQSHSEKEDSISHELNLLELNEFRAKFPVWKDADHFCISN